MFHYSFDFLFTTIILYYFEATTDTLRARALLESAREIVSITLSRDTLFPLFRCVIAAMKSLVSGEGMTIATDSSALFLLQKERNAFYNGHREEMIYGSWLVEPQSNLRLSGHNRKL